MSAAGHSIAVAEVEMMAGDDAAAERVLRERLRDPRPVATTSTRGRTSRGDRAVARAAGAKRRGRALRSRRRARPEPGLWVGRRVANRPRTRRGKPRPCGRGSPTRRRGTRRHRFRERPGRAGWRRTLSLESAEALRAVGPTTRPPSSSARRLGSPSDSATSSRAARGSARTDGVGGPRARRRSRRRAAGSPGAVGARRRRHCERRRPPSAGFAPRSAGTAGGPRPRSRAGRSASAAPGRARAGS